MDTLSSLYRRFRRKRCVFFVTFMGIAGGNVLLVDFMHRLINAASNMRTDDFWKLMLCFMGVLLVYLLVVVWSQYAFRALQYYGEMELKKHTFASFLRCHVGPKKKDAGAWVSGINNDVAVLSRWLSTGHVNMIGQVIVLFVYLLLMAGYNFVITLGTVGIILFVFILSKVFAEQASRFTGKQQSLYAKVSSCVHTCLANFPVISQLRNGGYFCTWLRSIHRQGDSDAIRGLSKFMALDDAMLTFMTNTLPLLVFACGLFFAKAGWMTMGSAIALMLVSQKLNEPIILIAALILDKKNAEHIYERLADIYASTAETGGEENVEPFESMTADIKTYRHVSSKDHLLDQVQFSLEKGDVVLIKGESGSGKTTMIDLLSRLIDYGGLEGTITYNGRAVTAYDIHAYYRHVLQVEQETVLVEGSIIDNLLLGDQYGEQEIQEVLSVCMLDDWYEERFPGFCIRENGKNVSGGERQRIGIARMLLRKPDVIILDEATSALDQHTRTVLVKRLIAFARKYQMTVLAISHHEDFAPYCNKTVELCEHAHKESRKTVMVQTE